MAPVAAAGSRATVAASAAAGRRALAVLQSRQEARNRLSVLVSPGKRQISGSALSASRSAARMRLMALLDIPVSRPGAATIGPQGSRALSMIIPTVVSPQRPTRAAEPMRELYPTMKSRKRVVVLSPPRKLVPSSKERIEAALKQLQIPTTPPVSQYPVVELRPKAPATSAHPQN